jgi:hypothetical protein
VSANARQSAGLNRKAVNSLSVRHRRKRPLKRHPPQGSTIDQLKELGQLKERGILTEEEFAAQKAKILGS